MAQDHITLKKNDLKKNDTDSEIENCWQARTAILTAAVAFQQAAEEVEARFHDMPLDIRQELIKEAGNEKISAVADILSGGDYQQYRQASLLRMAIDS